MEKTYKMLGIIIALAALAGVSTSCNNPVDKNALGTISIDGSPWVDSTLTVNTSTLGGSGTVYYHWRYRGSSDIISTDSVYLVRNVDMNRHLTVTVMRFDNHGSAGAEAGPVTLTPIGGSVVIDGLPWVDSTLAANTDILGGNEGISYQWRRSGSSEVIGTNNTYTVRDSDRGSSITVTVTRSGKSGNIVSEPTDAVIFTPLTGLVSINGAPALDSTLTANIEGLGGSGTIYYQWKLISNNGDVSNILNATGSTHTVRTNDMGNSITVTVTRDRNSGSVTSDTTGPVPFGGIVSISGTPLVGNTLTANTGTLGSGGQLSYAWMRSGSNDILDSVSTYTIRPTDVGSSIILHVSRDGVDGSVGASTTTVPTPVTIPGSAEIGQTISVNTTNFGGSGSFSYEWKRYPAEIIGTGSSYTVSCDDVGKAIFVTVARSGISVTSNATSTIPLGGSLTITGTVRVGETLTANIANLCGSGTIIYEWTRGGSDTVIGTGETYTVQFADAGLALTVTVSRFITSGSMSASTVTVPRPAVWLTMTGTAPLVGQTLPATTSNFPANTEALSYEWRVGGTPIPGTTNSTYTVRFDDVGHNITLTVSDASGEITGTTAAVPVPVTITGIARVDEALTANIDNISSDINVSYTWMHAYGPEHSEYRQIIPDASGSTYTVPTDYIGQVIFVRVEHELGAYTSAPTVHIVPADTDVDTDTDTDTDPDDDDVVEPD